MYEQFGGLVDQTAKTVTFKLFIPDGERVPTQYEGGALPRIRNVFVTGTFQNPPWNARTRIQLAQSDFFDGPFLKGFLYQYTTPPLSEGFYQYKYYVEFENAPPRLITDPCARYGGSEQQNSGFVVGGAIDTVRPLPGPRRKYADLVVYELMIDDFTKNLRQPNESMLQAVTRKLPYLADLGINAIEFMPWTAWMGDTDFSWGYNPVQYFSVAYRYTDDPSSERDKLVHLKRLINACHDLGIQVIMDSVFNHADAYPPDRGFPYYWLYQEPADSPYVGNFAEHAYFQDLDYANLCTLEYIRDSCIYWIDKFRVDGIRFDNTLGLYRPGDRGHGLPKLLSELRGHLSRTNNKDFALILEHEWDYPSIAVTNNVGATSCWLDPYRARTHDYLGDRPEGRPQVEPKFMRVLDSARDFDPGRMPAIYIENHDHRRVMRKAGGRDSWFLTQPYAIALFTCAGAPLLYNAQEFGQDDDMPDSGPGRVVSRPVDWTLATTGPGPGLLALYKKLIDLRKTHPGLCSPNFYPRDWNEGWTQLDSHGFGIDRRRNIVVYHRWGDDAAGTLQRFYVALNFSQETQHFSFEVPAAGPWTDLVGGDVQNAVNGRLEVDIGSNWGAAYFR